jgi:coproporphyrinogen III oxidase-like Fe-S oxidoreductase
MRMGMRRFSWLTNAFSKKVESHAAAIALHMMHYNFARKHPTLDVARRIELTHYCNLPSGECRRNLQTAGA